MFFVIPDQNILKRERATSMSDTLVKAVEESSRAVQKKIENDKSNSAKKHVQPTKKEISLKADQPLVQHRSETNIGVGLLYYLISYAIKIIC